MKRQDALGRFREQAGQIIEARDGMFWEVLFRRRTELAGRLRDGLERLAGQGAGSRERCRGIYGSFLRTDILDGKYRILLQMVGEGYILDPLPAETWADLQDFFQGLEKAGKDLAKEKLRYAGKVNDWDVRYLIADRVMEHAREIAFLLRFQLWKEENQKEIRMLIPGDVPRILRLGEYRDQGEIIFRTDGRPGGEERMKELLKQSFAFPYALQNQYFTRCAFRKLSAAERQLQYITFDGCVLEQISFAGASLWGARFRDCEITGCSFSGADLSMARFENCRFRDNDWKDAALLHTFCAPGRPPGLGAEQQAEVLTEEGRYDRAIFLCGAGQAGQGLHPSGRL